MGRRNYKIYAIYKGEKFLFEGNAKECADYFKVKEDTIWFWSKPANLKRDKGNRKIAIALED